MKMTACPVTALPSPSQVVTETGSSPLVPYGSPVTTGVGGAHERVRPTGTSSARAMQRSLAWAVSRRCMAVVAVGVAGFVDHLRPSPGVDAHGARPDNTHGPHVRSWPQLRADGSVRPLLPSG